MRETAMKLHGVGEVACGPSALMALCGVSAHECLDAIRDITGQEGPIEGVSCGVLVGAASRLGVDLRRCDDFRSVPRDQRPTVAAWANGLDVGSTCVVFAERPGDGIGHFLTVQSRHDGPVAIDNFTTAPVPVSEISWAKGIVTRTWLASPCRTLDEIGFARMERKRRVFERWASEDRALAETLAAGDEL